MNRDAALDALARAFDRSLLYPTEAELLEEAYVCWIEEPAEWTTTADDGSESA